jgi:hypothetical protein
MTKQWLALIVGVVVLLGCGAGCGSDKDKGINSGKDVPRPPQAVQK